MAKTTTERIESIDEKIEQLKQQKKAILAREKEKERKARTRRLIQKGGIVEKYLPGISDDTLARQLQLIVLFLQIERDSNIELTDTHLEALARTLNQILENK